MYHCDVHGCEEIATHEHNGAMFCDEHYMQMSGDVIDVAVHPLLNPNSTHYQMFDGVEAVERLEQMYSSEDLMAWSKISAMKYRLRIGHKDDSSKEVKKIRTFEDYYTYLKKKLDAN